MSVYLTDSTKRWPLLKLSTGKMQRLVPYEPGLDFLVPVKLDAVNEALGFTLFVLKSQMQDVLGKPYTGAWLKIEKGGGQCTVGYQNQHPQKLKYESANDNLCHELGHCLGLGHENFHEKNPSNPKGVHAEHAAAVEAKYESFGSFDPKSAMLYSEQAFAVPAAAPKLARSASSPQLEASKAGSRCVNKKFSANDIKAIKWLYGQGAVSLDNAEAHEVFWQL
jgi:hypothetical protein